jgi:DNA-binding NtrC family response regulator
VLQQREIVRVGGERTMLVDVRVIAASNKEFADLIPDGKFRLDLYYRLSTIVLRMPPLRDRPEDIPHLVRAVAQELSSKYGRPPPRLADAAMSALVRHPWPGNIRELRNTVERLFLLGGAAPSRAAIEDMLAADRTLGERLVPSASPHLSIAARRGRLDQVLARANGNKAAAARELGVTRKTIHKWLRER